MSWANDHGLDPATVLYDENLQYVNIAPAMPTVFTVRASNMLIWDRSEGWGDPTTSYWQSFLAWWPDFLNYCEQQPGSN